MSKPTTLEKPFLIKFDRLLIDAVEVERKVIGAQLGKHRESGELKLPPRTTVIRALVREAVNARRAARREEVPVVEQAPCVQPGASPEAEEASAAESAPEAPADPAAV